LSNGRRSCTADILFEATKSLLGALRQPSETKIAQAKKLFEEGFAEMRSVFDTRPKLYDYEMFIETLIDSIAICKNLCCDNQQLPADFLLQRVVDEAVRAAKDYQ
jgi:hypothetical protein